MSATDLSQAPHSHRLNAALHKDTADAVRELVRYEGIVGTTRLALATNPTAADTVTIGGDVYEFQAAAADLADDDYRAVLIGGSAAATRANLIEAINGLSDAAHASIFQTDSETPAETRGRLPIVAVEDGNGVRIRTADGVGGNVAARSLNAAVTSSLTDGSDGWEIDTLNLNTVGRDPSYGKTAKMQITVTADMLTAGSMRLDLPFQPTALVVTVQDSGNILVEPGSDEFEMDADGIEITFGAGASPDIQSTDILTIIAYE